MSFIQRFPLFPADIDLLARDGLRFTQFYSGYMICTPSRSSLLTGLVVYLCMLLTGMYLCVCLYIRCVRLFSCVLFKICVFICSYNLYVFFVCVCVCVCTCDVKLSRKITYIYIYIYIYIYTVRPYLFTHIRSE